MKIGDYHNIACPYCAKINHCPGRFKKFEFGKISYFLEKCYYCNEEICYHVEYALKVIAETKQSCEHLFEKII